MHETVMEVMVNVLGEGESKVRMEKMFVNTACFISLFQHFFFLFTHDAVKLLYVSSI